MTKAVAGRGLGHRTPAGGQDAVRTTTASFDQSLLPMLIFNGQRQYVDANRAACLLLRLPREQVLELTIGDLTPPEKRSEQPRMWEEFFRQGTLTGAYELQLPDGSRLEVEYAATANFAPGLHLTTIAIPSIDLSWPPLTDEADDGNWPLTDREREVLRLVAMGETGRSIGEALSISAATVETHVRHCVAKLGARNRPHAVAVALQRGEIVLTRD